MIVLGSTAVLGGAMLLVTLCAWALGRWQGGLARSAGAGAGAEDFGPGALQARAEAQAEAEAAPDPAAPPAAAASPCQSAARDERRAALAAAHSLGALHAEIVDYRRSEQVFARLDGEALRLDPLPRQGTAPCRFLGLTGQPTCGLSAGARAGCAAGIACGKAAAPALPRARPVQPSLVAAGLARV